MCRNMRDNKRKGGAWGNNLFQVQFCHDTMQGSNYSEGGRADSVRKSQSGRKDCVNSRIVAHAEDKIGISEFSIGVFIFRQTTLERPDYGENAISGYIHNIYMELHFCAETAMSHAVTQECASYANFSPAK